MSLSTREKRWFPYLWAIKVKIKGIEYQIYRITQEKYKKLISVEPDLTGIPVYFVQLGKGIQFWPKIKKEDVDDTEVYRNYYEPL